jgi:hypothetical protein
MQANLDRLDVSIFAATATAQHQHRETNSRCFTMISLPFETGLHQAGVSHDQDRAGTDEPEEGTKGCGDPEKRDTCGSVIREGT